MAQADQLDLLKLLLEANRVKNPGRVCQQLHEHGVTTLTHFAELSVVTLREWDIKDYHVFDWALRESQRLLRYSSHDLAAIRQRLLDHALYVTCDRGDIDRAQELLALGATVNYRSPSGWTPLHTSSYTGHTEVVAMLLQDFQVDVNACDQNGQSPLHFAAGQGHLGFVRILVENGASLSMKDKRGMTPLDRARIYSKHDVVEYLQQQLGDEDHTSTTAEDTHTDPNISPDSSPAVDPSDAMDSLGLNVTMSIINIGAQGYPGTGKTSLLDLAMGKDPAETRNSTGCIDPPSRYLVAKSKSSQGIKWDHVTSDKMFDMVCDAVKETIDNPQVQTETPLSSTDQPTPLEASQPNIPVKRDSEVVQVDEDETPDVPDDSHTSSLPSPRTIEPDRVPPKDSSWFLDLLKKTQESKGSGVIFDSHWMMMTDSGGQPPFLDASALFLQNSSLQIFSLKLNELLNHRPELSYFIDGKSACFSQSNLKLSNQQIIETMAKSVSAIQPAFTPSAIESPKGAKFAIVGTFEDQAHLCSETVEDKESTLDEALKPYKDFQVRYGGKLILPVNAITAEKEERERLATKLRKLIVEASGVTMKVLVKLRWFVFLLNMLTRAEKQKRSVLTLEECLELGKALEMKEPEVHKAIRFFRDINLIMHYDTPSLRNSVIVDAKPLLDKVSLLLSASFVDEGFLADHCGLVLPSGAKELLQQHGRFSPETLEKFNLEEPITKKFFLDVLVEVKAVAAIDNSSEYIMPCALTYLPDKECVPHPSTPWVIRFGIERGATEVFIPLPVGYLPALLVFLLTRFKSQFGLSDKECQFRNLFVLKYKRGGKVYIVERHLQLEIYFTLCEDFEFVGDCIVIRESILKAISLTEKRLRITENAITKVDSFLCSCSENAHHVCVYNHETGRAECEVTDDACALGAQHLQWIKSVPVTDAAAAPASSSQPSTTTKTPEKPSSHVVDGDTAPSSSQVSSTTPQGAVKMSSPVVGIPLNISTLNCLKYKSASGKVERLFVIDDMASRWRKVGLGLNFKPTELDCIESSQQKDPVKCCEQLMSQWLDGFVNDRDSRPKTWPTLLEVMGDARLGELADKIEKIVQ